MPSEKEQLMKSLTIGSSRRMKKLNVRVRSLLEG